MFVNCLLKAFVCVSDSCFSSEVNASVLLCRWFFIGKYLFLFIKLKEFHFLMLADLVDIFKVLNVLNMILPGKNINCINDYDVIKCFCGKTGAGHC